MSGEDALHQIWFTLGPVEVTGTVVTTWIVMAVLGGCSWISTRFLRPSPGRFQTLLEGIVSAMEESVGRLVPDHARVVLPFVGTLWIFLVTANLAGLVPGLDSPTADISLTAALAVLVFFSVHWFGVRIVGLRAFLKHYVSPSPVLLPFHLIGEVTRTMAMAIRLFGNMMSMEMAAVILLSVAGFLVPVPILMLHIVEALYLQRLFAGRV